METKKKSVLDLENAYAAETECWLCLACHVTPNMDMEVAILFWIS